VRSGDSEAWRPWWQGPDAESYYFMGKDNIVFHTEIWPAMLFGYSGQGDRGGKPGSLGELKQGVTTQIFGEGSSMGPLSEQDRRRLQGLDPALDYRVEWTSLVEYLQYAEKHGISQNVASYIGATTLRTYVAGHENRPLSAGELDTVRGLIREEMAAGALGIGSALIYPPGFFAGNTRIAVLPAATGAELGAFLRGNVAALPLYPILNSESHPDPTTGKQKLSTAAK